jgi:glyoxylase-like metal-dependent hydrolase (beta-lactamase superfamily II)
MIFQELVPGLWQAGTAVTNVFVLKPSDSDALTLIDAGTASFSSKIVQASKKLGEITNIIVTHAHLDHAGGLAGVVKQTDAKVWMHPEDAALVAQGRWARPYKPAPTLLGQLATWLYINQQSKRIAPVSGIQPVLEGDVPPFAGGIDVYHMPGHSAGQIALGWTSPNGQRVLFAADVCLNLLGLTEPFLYEDRTLGLQSIHRLAELTKQADVVVFQHGKALYAPELHVQFAHFVRRYAHAAQVV